MKLNLLCENRFAYHKERVGRLKDKITRLLGPVLDTFHREMIPAQEIWVDALTKADQWLDRAAKIDPLYGEANKLIDQAEEMINRVEQQRRDMAMDADKNDAMSWQKPVNSKKAVSDYYTNPH